MHHFTAILGSSELASSSQWSPGKPFEFPRVVFLQAFLDYLVNCVEALISLKF